MSRFFVTQHARERFVMRFFNPGCSLDEARKVLLCAGLSVDRQIERRLRQAARHVPSLTLHGATEYYAHDDALFVCEPIHDEALKRKRLTVVTVVRFEEFKENAARILAGRAVVRDGR